MTQTGNLVQPLPAPAEEEFFETLVETPQMRIERIVSHGHASADGFWYDQSQHEWVLLVAGAAELELEGQGRVPMAPGDWINLPAKVRHRVVSTNSNEATVWLAVHYQPCSSANDE